MKSTASNVDEYLGQIDPKWKAMVTGIRETILGAIPHGFEETLNYGMIGYVVPKSIFPAGYHVDPKEPLPFVNLAAQKNYVALYHLGLYAREDLKSWFLGEYEKAYGKKLDMGGSCMRFRKDGDIPYELITELLRKVSVEDYIAWYERARGEKKKPA